MTGRKTDRAALLRLADAFVEDILAASDEEILAEAREDRADPAATAARGRALFDTAMIAAGKNRLATAKAALAQQQKPATIIKLDPAEARRRLERVLRQDPDTARKLTLAARNGQGLSDNDVQGLLQDLADLGIDTDREES